MVMATTLVLALQVAGFSGVWERDPDQSDDAQAKMQEAFEQMRAEGGRGAGGGPPGGRAGATGRPGAPGMMSKSTAADELTIEHEGRELRVDDGEQLRIYYLDGEKHKRQMPNGTELETTAELRGNAVSIEEKMRRGEILRKLEIAPDGQTLVVTSTMELPGMKDPVVIRTVYQRLEGETPGP